MTILDEYISRIKVGRMAPGEVYLEISKRLERYSEDANFDDEQHKELIVAYSFFAHMLAKIYLEEHGL